MKVYFKKANMSVLGPITNHKFMGHIKKSFKINELARIDGDLYQCCRVITDERVLFERLDVTEGDEVEDCEWTCPLCGYVDEDSFELEAKSDQYKCPACGSVTAYETEMVTMYAVKLKKAAKIKTISMTSEMEVENAG